MDKSEQEFILQQRVRWWESEAFGAQVDLKIAERLKDEGIRERAMVALRRAETALAVLREELGQVGDPGSAPLTPAPGTAP